MSKNVFFGAVVFVMAASVGVNYMVNNTSPNKGGARNVANLDMNASLEAGTMNWEQELAKSLARDKKIKNTQMGEKPTVLDQMLFGDLQGKYNLQFNGSELKQISLKPSEPEGLNVPLKQIVTGYSAIFSKVDGFQQVSKADDTEVYSWKDDKGRTHKATVKMNPGQQVQTISFE